MKQQPRERAIILGEYILEQQALFVQLRNGSAFLRARFIKMSANVFPI